MIIAQKCNTIHQVNVPAIKLHRDQPFRSQKDPPPKKKKKKNNFIFRLVDSKERRAANNVPGKIKEHERAVIA